MRPRGRITANDTVAILGCGGVGLGAVAASSCRGAPTICVDVDAETLVEETVDEKARRAEGAKYVIDRRTERFCLKRHSPIMIRCLH